MAKDKGKDFQATALEKLVEARRTAIESIAKGHGKLKKHLSLLTDAQAGIDVLKKEKAEISKSFENKVTKVVRSEEENGNW
jgi:nitrogen regulatory protein PII